MAIDDDKKKDIDNIEETEEELDLTDIEEEDDLGSEDTENDNEFTYDEDEEPEEEKQKPLSSVESKYIAERKKRQEAEAQLTAQNLLIAQYKDKMEESSIEDYRKQKYDRYIALGYDEDLARTISDDLTETYSLAKSTTRPAESNSKALEIKALRNKSEYFDNAEAYSTKILEQMDEFEKLGKPITAQQAYMLVVDPTQRQQELEQRKKAKASSSANTSPDSTITSSSTKPSRSKMSSQDLDALRVLQKNDPTGNWTEKKYNELMKRHMI